MTPPTSRNRTCGRIASASTIPRSVADPPRSSTANARATGAIAEPANETTRPKKRSRKLRWRSGAKTPSLDSRFTPLAPVALEPQVALGVRGSLVVLLHLVGVGGEAVGPGGGDERLLVHSVGDSARPAVQRRPKLREMRGHVLEHAEVGQREPRGLAALGLHDSRLP